jgi:hypothetical protein
MLKKQYWMSAMLRFMQTAPTKPHWSHSNERRQRIWAQVSVMDDTENSVLAYTHCVVKTQP